MQYIRLLLVPRVDADNNELKMTLGIEVRAGLAVKLCATRFKPQ